MVKRLLKKASIFILALILLIPMFPSFTQTKADVNVSFDNTKVLDDLKDATIKGEAFDLRNYGYNPLGELQLLTFVEYAYSADPSYYGYYGLYLYLYNPANIDLDLFHVNNEITLDVGSNPSRYDTYKLKFCSVSTGDYANLFIKYKVVDRAIDDKFIVERVNSNERCYNIGEIELVHKGDLNASPIFNKNSDGNESGYTFKFSGYAEGCGLDATAKSTLTGSFEELEVIELNIKHTFWRSKGSSKGENWQNQVNSVWFSVPNSFLDKYGKLQRIKAEWYEYFTKDIIVVDNEDRYKKLLEYIANPNTEDLYLSVAEEFQMDTDIAYLCDWIYNNKYPSEWSESSGCEVLDTLYYLFWTGNNSISEYDPYINNLENGGISGNELYDYILNYNKSYDSGSLGIKGGKHISADLFEVDIPEERKRSDEYGEIKKGYSCYEFDVDTHLLDWLAFNDVEQKPNITSVYERLMYQFGFKKLDKIDEEGVSGLSPIEIITPELMGKTDAELVSELFININNVPQIRDDYQQALQNNETLVLFRFALSPYYCRDAEVVNWDYWFEGANTSPAYRAKQSVFLDFDVISLTFNNEGDMTVIPVVSAPIDIVNDITTPTIIDKDGSGCSNLNWKQLLIYIGIALLVLIAGVPLFIYLGPYLLKGLMLLFKFIIKLITAPFRLVSNSIKKRKANKNSNSYVKKYPTTKNKKYYKSYKKKRKKFKK